MEIVQCALNDKLLSTVKAENLLPSAEILPEGVHSLMVCSPPRVESLPRKNKPCYGWLSSDDEEEQDTVSLLPTT